jgi:hypothetical protein
MQLLSARTGRISEVGEQLKITKRTQEVLCFQRRLHYTAASQLTNEAFAAGACGSYDDDVTSWKRRAARISLLLVLAAVACVSIPKTRHVMLTAAGSILVADDPMEHADVIVIAVDSDGAGALETADLVHSGVASRVAVFVDASHARVEDEFMRRGISDEGATARLIRQLRALGIDAVDRVPGYVAGSEDEGPVLAAWCDQQRFRSVVVVSTADHSRRLRRMLHRSMKGHSTLVAVRSARYSTFRPEHWWESHGGTRTEVEELEKLLLDFVRHPIS